MARPIANHRQKWLDFFGIFLIALVVRLLFLTSSPPSLYWEEVALGYDAYSILKTGKDHHGNSWPLIAFESFGDYKPSGYFYATVPSIAIFGLNSFGVRFPAALFGALTAAFLYLLLLEVGRNRKLALFSGVVLTFLPWHLHFSRAGFEVVLATFLLVTGIWFVARARQQVQYLVPAVFCLVGSMYTYHGLRILAPLFGLGLLLFWGKAWITSKWFYLSGLLTLLLLLPLLLSLTDPVIQQRFNETNLFAVSHAVPISNELREADGNTVVSKILHHRYWIWGQEILGKVFNHFDFNFLFGAGDGNPRHQTGFTGLLFYWQLVPLLLGLYFAALHFKQWGWLLAWVVFATIPPALTVSPNHSLRFLPAAPAFAVLIGLGFIELEAYIRKLRLRFLLSLFIAGLILFEFGAYGFDYLNSYPKRSSQDWQYGYEELYRHVSEVYDDYEMIYITRDWGRPAMYAFFFMNIDPRVVQAAEVTAPQDQGEILAFDKIYFGEPGLTDNSLVVTTMPWGERKPIRIIRRLDGEEVFYLYET